MSSAASESAAETAALYQSLMTDNCVGLAATVVLLYDFLLCMGKEFRYVWRPSQSSRKISRLLYLYIRYMSLLSNILALVMVTPVSDASCTALSWLDNVWTVLNLIGPAVFTILRVYALSGRNALITGFTLLLSISPFVVNVATLYLFTAVNLPPPQNCVLYQNIQDWTSIALTVASRAPVVLADTLAVIVTWRRTRITNQLSTDRRRQLSLEHTLWENGNIYFCIVVSLNVVDIILTVLSIATPLGDGGGSYVIAFVDPISTILICRFLLALYETNDILERGSSSVSPSSADFGRTGRTGSPSLPEFLNPLAGPICTFADGDSELFDGCRAPLPEANAEEEVKAEAVVAAYE